MTNANHEASDDEAEGETDPRYHLLRPDEWRSYTRYHFLVAKLIFFAAIGYAALWLMDALGNVLFPVFISGLIAYLFDPLVDWFEEKGLNRTVGILIILIGALAFGGLFVLILYPTVVEQIQSVSNNFSTIVELFRSTVIPWAERELGYEIPESVDAMIQKYNEPIRKNIGEIANRATGWVQEILLGTGAVVGTLINIVAIPFFTYYFLRDFDRIRRKVSEFIPLHRRDYVLNRAAKMDEVVGEWVRGQLQVASILAVLYSIGLIIPFQACGLSVRAAIAVGVLTGLLNFVPYFGVAVGIVLSTLMVLINLNGAGAWPLVANLLVFVSVQTLEGYILTPRIVGEKVGMTPVTVIIVIMIGGELFGFIGILLAVPMFGALKVLLPDAIDYYKGTGFFTGDYPGPASGEEESPSDGAEGAGRSRSDSDAGGAGREEEASESDGAGTGQSDSPESGDGDAGTEPPDDAAADDDPDLDEP